MLLTPTEDTDFPCTDRPGSVNNMFFSAFFVFKIMMIEGNRFVNSVLVLRRTVTL